MVKAVFFDLWNTLVYCPTKEKVEEMVSALGLSGRIDYYGFIEELDRTVFVDSELEVEEALIGISRRYGADPSDTQLKAASDLWGSRLQGAEFFPDVKPALEELSKTYRLGVISNTDRSGAEYLKSKPIFKEFHVTVMSCYEGYAKPEKAIFEAAAHGIGVKPSDAWMVGDNPKDDVEGARKAGLNAILIDRLGRHKAGKGYHVIRSLTEIKEVIE
ncbi:MAG: HAD family hydrolase [Candidatus Altiarchaeota archaeon]